MKILITISAILVSFGVGAASLDKYKISSESITQGCLEPRPIEDGYSGIDLEYLKIRAQETVKILELEGVKLLLLNDSEVFSFEIKNQESIRTLSNGQFLKLSKNESGYELMFYQFSSCQRFINLVSFYSSSEQ